MAPQNNATLRVRKKKPSTVLRPRPAQAAAGGGTKSLCSHCGGYFHPSTVWRHETQHAKRHKALVVGTLPVRERRHQHPYQPSPEPLPVLTAEELALSPLGSSELNLETPKSDSLTLHGIRNEDMDVEMDMIDMGMPHLNNANGDGTGLNEAELDGIFDQDYQDDDDNAQANDNDPSSSTSRSSSPSPSSSSSSSSSSTTDDELDEDLASNELAQQRPNISAILPPPQTIESNLNLYIGRRRQSFF